MNRVLELISKGIESPEKIPPFIRKQYTASKHRIRYRNVPRQKGKIHDFIRKKEFDILVLDSCRFDYFRDEVGSYLSGDLEKVYTPVTATINYVQTIWDGQYDLTYVTGMPAPTNHAFERKGLEYRPEEHFADFVHVWQTCNQKELGAVPPEAMTEVALRTDAKRKVVHYVQPHAPYIGEYRLRDPDGGTDWGDSLDDVYEKIGRYDLSDKVISDEELQRAYRNNLHRVLAAVREYVTRVDRPVAVTGDHGEFLGEEGRYIHGGPRHPILCEVPWFVVDSSLLGSKEEASEASRVPETVEYDDRDVEQQLEQLGYL